jgi:hypothetical protein
MWTANGQPGHIQMFAYSVSLLSVACLKPDQNRLEHQFQARHDQHEANNCSWLSAV